MKLLIVTQKVNKNDPILGFFHRWIEEFSKHVEKLTVICLEEGVHDLPENVTVLSLGKERHVSKLTYAARFYRYIWTKRKDYDAVFVHMNPEYVVLGSTLLALLKKPIYLWYVHKNVDKKLRLAVVSAKKVFTSSKESFGVDTNKVIYMGHGIDTSLFAYKKRKDSRTLVHIGRITPIKHCETLIAALHLLRKNTKQDWQGIFIGGTLTKNDMEYAKDLKVFMADNGLGSSIKFTGPIQVNEITKYLGTAFASANMAPTGGMDKAVLESLAVGCPVFVSNEAFKDVIGEYWDVFSFKFNDAADLGMKVAAFAKRSDMDDITLTLSKRVRSEYEVSKFIERLMEYINA